MKRNIIVMVAMTVAALQLTSTSCKNYLKEGTIDLGIEAEVDPNNPGGGDDEDDNFTYPTSYTFNHPCGLFTQADFDRVKARLASSDPSDPVSASYVKFCESKFAAATYTAAPVETLVRGSVTGTGVASENYIIADRDAAAALQLAMRYKLTGNSTFADASVAIMNAWADVCKRITAGDSNQYLLAGFQGYQFANAAELLRNYAGWAAQDFADFKQWLLEVWYTKNYEFIYNHGYTSTCNLHYWSNWELANLASILAIGILTEDVEKINFAVRNFREGAGSGCINNMIPYDPVPDPDKNSVLLAQNMESGRDQGHATLVISMCAELCQMASNIGLDFWGMKKNKVLAMCEYTAKFNYKLEGASNFPYPIESMPPFQTYNYCVGCSCSSGHSAVHTNISSSDRGTIRPGWDLIRSHYKQKGVDEKAYYYTDLFATRLRYTGGVLTGDGGAGDGRYGENSSAFDQVGWGTLMFYRD